MRVQLFPHPTTPRPDLTLDVEIRRSGERLSLEYRLGGAVMGVRWPDPQPRERTDGLWRTTCFEAFVGGDADGYVEFNLSPSGAWAAYGFDGYRDGMRPLDIPPPASAVRHAPQAFALTADLTLPTDAGSRIGLSAVIEGLDGTISYWALAHSSDKPDFHSSDTRLLDLP
jgi:hypothetical protein